MIFLKLTWNFVLKKYFFSRTDLIKKHFCPIPEKAPYMAVTHVDAYKLSNFRVYSYLLFTFDKSVSFQLITKNTTAMSLSQVFLVFFFFWW